MPTILSMTAWADLGAGPLRLAAIGAPLQYVVASGAPAAPSALGAAAAIVGFVVKPGEPAVEIDSSENVYAAGITAGASAVTFARSPAEVLTTDTVASASTGLDFSANTPALPVVGANFGASGPYANFDLLSTVPANAARLNVEVHNMSTGNIVVARDDGTADAEAAPANASLFALAASQVWGSRTFSGRLQVYGASGSQVAVFED